MHLYHRHFYLKSEHYWQIVTPVGFTPFFLLTLARLIPHFLRFQMTQPTSITRTLGQPRCSMSELSVNNPSGVSEQLVATVESQS